MALMKRVEGTGKHQPPFRSDSLRDQNEQPVTQQGFLLVAGGFCEMKRVELLSLFRLDTDEGSVRPAPLAVGLQCRRAGNGDKLEI